MSITAARERKFTVDPGGFIRKAIRDYVFNSPNNRFPAFPAEHIWDDPLVGFADGDDPIFKEYKTVIGDFHLTPREALEMYIDANGCGDKAELIPHLSVIAFVLPATEKTRLSNREETQVCSVRWNNTRFIGQEFVARLTRYIVTLIEELGYFAIAPELSRWWEIVKQPSGLSSRWSQRHAAYAAGLGTFGLSDSFISSKGAAGRIGSVICNLELPSTPRRFANHYANCLFLARGSCQKCAERCPAKAISSRGHDKIKCSAYLNEMKTIAQRQGRTEGYVGKAYLGCGFCQTGVPCEAGIPVNQG
jgi:epoxyqueuosine reductase